MAVEFVYHAEDRCESSGAPAGAFPLAANKVYEPSVLNFVADPRGSSCPAAIASSVDSARDGDLEPERPKSVVPRNYEELWGGHGPTGSWTRSASEAAEDRQEGVEIF